MPGTLASVSSSIRVMANASPTFSSFTLASVWIRSGVGRAQQLFRVGRRLPFLEPGLERIGAFERPAPDFQPSGAFGQIAVPFRFRFSCWHYVSFRFAV